MAGAFRRARAVVRHPLFIQSATILAIVVGIHWKLLFEESGCVNWGNFVIPCDKSQYSAWGPILLTWYPFSYMGAPVTFPFVTVMNQLTSWAILSSLAQLLGPAIAAKLFIVGSTTFLGVTFLLFARCFIRSVWGQWVAALFLLAGPFQLALYGAGDYVQFVAQGFVFLSIWMLWLAVRYPLHRWLLVPGAFLVLLLSLSIIQIFALGLALFVFSLIVFVFRENAPLRIRTRRFAAFAFRLVLVPLVLAPFLLPILFAPSTELGPVSSYAPPLGAFHAFSAPPLSVFLGAGYVWSSGTALTNNFGYAMVASVTSGSTAGAWLIVSFALVLSTWAALLLLRIRSAAMLFVLVVIAALVGSGAYGPLANLNRYLYTHVSGYQELYASFWWDWLIIVPATAMAIGLLLEYLLTAWADKGRQHSRNPPPKEDAHSTPRRGLRRRFPVPRRLMAGMALLVVAGLVAVSVALPFATGAQYGPLAGGMLIGAQTLVYPSEYSQVPGELARLVGSNYSGVAVFNPSPEWFLLNSTIYTQNYFYYFPTVRTPSLPGFAIPPYASDFYSYWVYNELYTNATQYVGELLALEGIQFLLVFYGTQPGNGAPFSNGVNVSHLLQFQQGIVPVTSSQYYSIYDNEYYNSVVSSLSGLSIVAGPYSALNAMAYAGIGVNDQGVVFPSDIPAGECDQYLNHTSRIYAESTNGLLGLGLACGASSSANPLSYIPVGVQVQQGWTSSYSDTGALGLGIVDAWPTPLAVTYGDDHVLAIPVSVTGCGPACSLWVPVLFEGQSDSTSLTFQWGSSTWNVETGHGWNGVNNSMVWVQLPIGASGDQGDLMVTSTGDYNAIGTVYAESNQSLMDWLDGMEQKKPVVVVTPGLTIAMPPIQLPGQSASYNLLNSNEALESSSLTLVNPGSSPMSIAINLPPGATGWLSLLVRALGTAELSLGPGATQGFGFHVNESNWSSPVRMGWIRVPVNSSDLSPGGSVNLALNQGAVFLSEAVFSPTAAFASPLTSSPGFDLIPARLITEPTLRNLTVVVSNSGPGQVTVAGSLELANTTPNQYLGSVWFNESEPPESDLALEYSIPPGIVVTVDGIWVAGNGGDGPSQFTEPLVNWQLENSATESVINFGSTANYTGATRTLNFRLVIHPALVATESNLTDTEASRNGTISVDTSGYTISGAAPGILLIRVPFYSNLEVEPAQLRLDPAIGGLATIVWGLTTQGTVHIIPTSGDYLNLGGIILAVSSALWGVFEYLNARREGRFVRILRTKLHLSRA